MRIPKIPLDRILVRLCDLALGAKTPFVRKKAGKSQGMYLIISKGGKWVTVAEIDGGSRRKREKAKIDGMQCR